MGTNKDPNIYSDMFSELKYAMCHISTMSLDWRVTQILKKHYKMAQKQNLAS